MILFALACTGIAQTSVVFFINGKWPLWLWLKIENTLICGIPSMTAAVIYTIYVLHKLIHSTTKTIQNIAHVMYTVCSTVALISLFVLITLKSSLNECVFPILILSVVVAVGEGVIHLHQQNTHVLYTRSSDEEDSA